jgi:hypothetical protein
MLANDGLVTFAIWLIRKPHAVKIKWHIVRGLVRTEYLDGHLLLETRSHVEPSGNEVKPGYNELTLQLAMRLHVMPSVQFVTPQRKQAIGHCKLWSRA